jgi:hypothetical protein
MVQRKSGIETISAPFTDHHALVLRVTLPVPTMRMGILRWKMEPTVMNDDALKRKIRENWIQWRSRKRHYPHVAMWWERCVKNQLQRLVREPEGEE